MGDGIGAHIAGRAVADAVARGEGRAGFRPPAMDVVAEAELGAAVMLHLDDEMRRIRLAVQQIPVRLPGLS